MGVKTLRKRVYFNTRPDERIVLRGMRIRRNRFYNFPESVLQDCGHPYEEVGVDSSKIGTELGRLLSQWGARQQNGCSCNSLARLMNQADIAWIERHKDELVRMISDNTAKMQYRKRPLLQLIREELRARLLSWFAVRIPEASIRWCLDYAIKKEKQRLKRGE